MEQQFQEFADLFVHYLCSRCISLAGDETAQPISPGSGLHSHNGEMLKLIKPTNPISARIISAFTVYTQHKQKQNLQSVLARAYNKPIESRQWVRAPVVRAAVALINSRNDTWLKHGIEHMDRIDYNHMSPFPPPDTRYEIGEQTSGKLRRLNRYAVDQDRFPFQYCADHILDRQEGCPWSAIAAFIPVGHFVKYRGQLYIPNDRDHLYAHSNIPLTAWTHIIWEEDKYTEYQQQLKSRSVPVIHIQTVKKLAHLLNILDCYADTLILAKPG